MSDTAHVTIYAQGHPINSWILYPLAAPSVAIDADTPQRLRWGKNGAHTFSGVTAGEHTLEFELRYKGFSRPVARVTETISLTNTEHVRYRVRNGWANQDPFSFARIT